MTQLMNKVSLMARLKIKVTEEDEFVRLDFIGPARQGDLIGVYDFFEKYLLTGKHMILDLTKCNHISSAVLSAFLSTYRELNLINRRLMLVGVSKSVEKLLEVTALAGVFEIYFDLEKALGTIHD